MKRRSALRAALVALGVSVLLGGAVTRAQQKPAADPAAMFKAFEGTWVYVVKTKALGKDGRSVGLVTFTKTGTNALTFTAASRAGTPSKEHQGFEYTAESGKLWWDAQRGKVARQEGKEGAEYIDLINLGYAWTETFKEGLPARGIKEAVTLKARMEYVRSNDTLLWVAQGTNAKGEVLYTGRTVFTRVQEQ